MIAAVLRSVLFWIVALSTSTILGAAPGLQQQIPAAEYEALVDFYHSTGGANWTRKDGWLDPAAASWFGVMVTGVKLEPDTGTVIELGTVTGLSLAANGLTGNLPDSLGGLSNLRNLELHVNSLTGNVPDTLGDLSKLEVLHLFNNQLTGGIPEALGRLTNLQSLHLSGNQLSGTIPESLGDLTSLWGLFLDYNNLDGGIPDSFRRLDLGFLSLPGNALAGELPAFLSHYTRLRYLNISQNEFTGSIPSELSSLVHLEELYLSDNRLTGTVPDFSENPTFRILSMSANCFVTSPGSPVRIVIEQMLAAGKTVWFGSQNNDCAPLAQRIPPEEYQALVDLYNSTGGPNWSHREGWLDPAATSWYGVGVSAPELDPWTGGVISFGAVTNLDLSFNGLSGPLPDSLVNLTRLENLTLDFNLLTGSIPSSVGDLTNLRKLSLAGNKLTGGIPSSLGRLAKLLSIHLYNNYLTGSIPDSLGDLTQLETLHLGVNRLSKTIPASIGNLTSLTNLALPANLLMP